MTSVLEAEDLIKDFAGVRAVDGVGFALAAGTCFGLLGPNGAGKTTTVEMLEGISTPTGGTIRFKGAPRGADFRDRAGIQFQKTALPDFMTVREALTLFARFYERTLAIDELVALCALGGYLDRYCNRVSGGQRQRLLVAIALINDPELVFLDEPTTGLDPQARRNFWDLVERIRGQGKTVLLTTHYMEEAARLCDDLAIMDHGRIIARGPPDTLLAEHFGETVIELPASDLAADTAALPGTCITADGRVEIVTQDVRGVLDALMRSATPMASVRIRERTLEDLFLELTGEELRA
jgi:ABC-2 type transport system ATP-binding protein